MAVGRKPVTVKGRIARTRPPGREQTGLAKQALEYDLQDLADKSTQVQLVRIMNQSSPGVPGSVSYALVMPLEYIVTGSPGVNGGTFSVDWADELANLGLWGPVSGPADTPGFRLQQNPDLPGRSQIKIDSTPFGATVTPDAATASQFKLVATSNFILAAPINMLDGQKMTIRITQDGTGGRVMTLAAAYRYSTYLTSAFVVLSSLPGATDYLGIEYNADAGKFDIVAFVPGVS